MNERSYFVQLKARLSHFFSAGDWPGALSFLQSELVDVSVRGHLAREESWIYLSYATCYTKWGKLSEAEHYLSLLKTYPESNTFLDAEIALYNSKVASQRGDFENAKSLLEKIWAQPTVWDVLDKERQLTFLWRLGLANLMIGDENLSKKFFHEHGDKIPKGGFREANNILFGEIICVLRKDKIIPREAETIQNRIRHCARLYVQEATDTRDQLAHRGKPLVQALLIESLFNWRMGNMFTAFQQALVAADFLKRWNLTPYAEGVGEALAVLREKAPLVAEIVMSCSNSLPIDFLRWLNTQDESTTLVNAYRDAAIIAERAIASKNWMSIYTSWPEVVSRSSRQRNTERESVLKGRNLDILHLSDLQFGTHSVYNDKPIDLADALARDIEYLLSVNVINHPSVIAVSGDVADIGIPEEYEKAKIFFTRLLEKLKDLGCPLSMERVIMVPGNHDVCYPLTRPGSANDSLGKYKLAPFAEFTNTLQQSPRWSVENDFNILDLSKELDVILFGLNSSVEESPYEHRGAIDPIKCRLACETSRKISATALKVAIFHHNVTPIIDYADKLKRAKIDYLLNSEEIISILREYKVSLILHGHIHVVDQRKTGICTIGAPSLGVVATQRPGLEQDALALRGYLVVRILGGDGEKKVTVRGREFKIGEGGVPKFGPIIFGDNQLERELTLLSTTDNEE